MTENENKIFTRDEILETLTNELNILKKKIESGRIVNPENEKIYIQYHKTIIYGCYTYNNILKDKQVDLMAKDLKNIKEAIAKNEEIHNLSSSELKNVNELLDEACKITEG